MRINGSYNEWAETIPDQKLFYIVSIDGDGNFIHPQSFICNLQQALEDVNNKSIFDLLTAGDHGRFKEAMSQCKMPGDSITVETKLNGGTEKTVRWEITSFLKPGNNPVHFLCTGHDITAGERINGPDPVNSHHPLPITVSDIGIVMHTKEGILLAATQRTAGIFGTSLSDIYKNGRIDKLWKATKDHNDASLIQISTGTTHTSMVLNFKTNSGSIRCALINSLPMPVHDQSVPYSFVSIIIDITSKRLAGPLSHDSVLLSFLDQTPNFKWIIDEKANIVYANKSLLRYFDKNESILKQNIYAVLPQAIAHAVHEKYRSVLDNSGTHTSILRTADENEKKQVFQVSTFPVYGPQRMVGGEAVNISEGYKAHLQLKKTKKRLLYISKITSEAIWDWNIRQGQIFRNEALQNLIGFHHEAASDLSWWHSRIHEEDRERVANKIQDTLHKNLRRHR